MQKISENVYVETTWRGCNPGYVTTSKGVVMIDTPQDPSDAKKLKDEISEKGEVLYIINTEHHADHVTNNHLFSGALISHQKTRDALENQNFRVPEITFSNRMNLYIGDHTFELMHLPGHTAGEIAVYIPQERVIFTGDNIFYKVQTFLHDALPFEWLESLEKLEKIEADIIVPGHGEVCDKSYIEEQSAFIKEWIDAVNKAISEGLTLKEASKKVSFIDRYPMDVGLNAFSKTLQRMNVNRLYKVLESKLQKV